MGMSAFNPVNSIEVIGVPPALLATAHSPPGAGSPQDTPAPTSHIFGSSTNTCPSSPNPTGPRGAPLAPQLLARPHALVLRNHRPSIPGAGPSRNRGASRSDAKPVPRRSPPAKTPNPQPA